MTIIRDLKEREGALVRYIETLDRKIRKLDVDRAQMKGVLAFHRQDVRADELLPHMDFRRFFGTNELRRYCLQVLKAAPDGLTSRDVARYVMSQKGADADDEVQLAKLVDRVANVLIKLRFKKLVESPMRRNGVTVWKIASAPTLAAPRRRSKSLIGRN